MLPLGTQCVAATGRLEIGGCDAVGLTAQFGTPLYVIDEELVRARCREYRYEFGSRYPQIRVVYAGKAFLCLAMCRLVEREGLYLDVASGGELQTGLYAGFPAERMVFHGNNKSPAELRAALDCGVGRIVVDNLYELDLLEPLVVDRRRPQEVLVRVTPGVDPQTHRRIRTGQADTKFGLNVASGAAMQGIKRVIGMRGLLLAGLHAHVGSNLRDSGAQIASLETVLELAEQVRQETGLTVEELNLGGGLAIRYLAADEPVAVAGLAETLTSALHDGLARRHLPPPVLAVEPGRSIVGEAGVTLYSVGAIKEVPIMKAPGTRLYVSVDGGMSDNPRPQLYDAVYTAFVANRASAPADTTVRVVGKHCETDILIDSAVMQRPQPGDVLAVQSTGAYNYSMASNYNRLPRPAVVFVRDGQARLVVQRETLDDLLRLDVMPQDV